jgi:glycosyltransferase involved in cell wall biosynthesis
MHHLLSIIVPIYNVENYLPQCIHSVLQQGFQDYELILVDDGSPDFCPQICDDVALKDNRIRVIHKKNGGLSDARNAGMEISKGQYILFLDSDDYLTEECLQKAAELLMKSNRPDLLMGTFNSLFSEQEKEWNRFQLTDLTGNTRDPVQTLSDLLNTNHEIPWSAWRNIYKREFIQCHHLKFEKGLVGAEDCAFFMEYIKYVRSYVLMEYPLINYRVSREGSITNNIKFSAIIGQLHVFSKYFYDYHRMKRVESNGLIICRYFAEKFANAISSLHLLVNRNEISKAEKFVQNHKEILNYARGKKYFFAKILWQTFGYYRGSQIMHKVRQ